MKSKRVLVAMSGGVDSSVAALLMKRKGYEVIGAFMKNWSDTKDEFGECNWKKEREYAIKIASKLNIPLITFDFEKEYKDQVVKKMLKDYKKGVTPNPDVDCNQKIKFPMLIKEAKKLGAEFIVTGHFSKIKKSKNNFKLLRAKDESKDQSYFLYRINQKELKHTLFPIGEYTKAQVRQIAKENKFPNFDKKSTVGICFIGKVDFKEFLKKRIKEKNGKILNPEGKIIGGHKGIHYYTIGEKLGTKYGTKISKQIDNESNLRKWYVAKKDAKKNNIVAAPEGHKILLRKQMKILKPHWIDKKPKNNSKVLVRIRQVGELLPGKVYSQKGKIKVTLNKSITGVSEGQAIVLYKGKEVLGGGEIRF
ncbi:MAG: tRNA 2-thiouridine(34) synthase MnmA [Candidatus Pacearchaeota archaeon]